MATKTTPKPTLRTIQPAKNAPVDKRPLKKSTVVKKSAPKSYRTPAKAVKQMRRRYSRLYVLGAVLILLATTSLWSFMGAKLQQSNTDQLVNTFLFEHWSTFRNASFPIAHSYLIKWPFFLIIKLLGPTDGNFIGMTVVISLLTVMGLGYILYRIDRRPVVFGTICLALASVLLLVPPQPYPGGILPINFAMVATRNLEYLIYVASLVALIRSPKFRSRQFWLALAGLSLLAASDKLFLTFSLGGAAMALVVYAVRKRWSLVRIYFNWLVASIAAFVVAAAIIWLINTTHLTHITGRIDSSPYGLSHNLHTLAVGTVFLVLGVMTNFGANPAFDATLLRSWPHLAAGRVASVSGLSFVVNIVILGFAIYAAIRILLASLTTRPKKPLGVSSVLALMLIWSSVLAGAVFVLSKHDYVVDARYLTLLLFAGFVSVAAYLRHRSLTFTLEKLYMIIGLLCAVSIFLGLFSVLKTYNADSEALVPTSDRNALVLQSLLNHPVDTLVGDYWRVVPVKAQAPMPLEVTPLDDCTHPRGVLDSTSWQPDLRKHSFAYLLSLDRGLTNYPSCSLEQVIAAYGKPNQSVLTAGSLGAPKEFLLFYDRGAHTSAPTTPRLQPVSSTVLPLSLDQLPNTTCPTGATTVNVVAHQDDDLLFLSPDLLREIKAGKCVRTVYVTAGDDGSGKLYWQARERGSEAAYSSMIGADNIWVHRTVKLADRAYIITANPRGNPRISLIFMRLPDGNLHGQGFSASHYESLEKLDSNQIASLSSVDGQSIYNSANLTSSLATLLKAYQPTNIDTQASYNAGHAFADHSDHIEVGRYVKRAYDLYSDHGAVITYYIGYPVRESPQNVTGTDLGQKAAAFFAYARYDGAVCGSIEDCRAVPTYGSYLPRQYTTK
jgi:LmbE family N-acetylglucosaminyl deacetylase